MASVRHEAMYSNIFYRNFIYIPLSIWFVVYEWFLIPVIGAPSPVGWMPLILPVQTLIRAKIISDTKDVVRDSPI